MDKVTEKRKVQHPIEDIFNISSGSTEIVVETTKPSLELVPHESYDGKDVEIEKKLEQIANAALDGYDSQVLIVEDLEEPKFAARNMEVANALLATALGAVKEISEIKKHKDKLAAQVNKPPKTVNQNLIVGSRNEILKRLLQEDDSK